MQVLPTLLALAAAFHPATADFWIYQTKDPWCDGGCVFFVPSPPSCDDVLYHTLWFQPTSDVSGSKQGVRCVGCGENDVDVIEWHNAMGHFTVYKNRGYLMVDLTDKPVGTCRADASRTFECYNYKSASNCYGNSLIFCESDFVADPINAHLQGRSEG